MKSVRFLVIALLMFLFSCAQTGYQRSYIISQEEPEAEEPPQNLE